MVEYNIGLILNSLVSKLIHALIIKKPHLSMRPLQTKTTAYDENCYTCRYSFSVSGLFLMIVKEYLRPVCVAARKISSVTSCIPTLPVRTKDASSCLLRAAT